MIIQNEEQPLKATHQVMKCLDLQELNGLKGQALANAQAVLVNKFKFFLPGGPQ
jgi:hypothetical protein